MTCAHEDFAATVNVHRLEKSDKSVSHFQADVRVVCSQCGTPFRFLGLPAGLDLNGAAVSLDGVEARLAIAPKGEVRTVMDGAPLGFTVRRVVP